MSTKPSRVGMGRGPLWDGSREREKRRIKTRHGTKWGRQEHTYLRKSNMSVSSVVDPKSPPNIAVKKALGIVWLTTA